MERHTLGRIGLEVSAIIVSALLAVTSPAAAQPHLSPSQPQPTTPAPPTADESSSEERADEQVAPGDLSTPRRSIHNYLAASRDADWSRASRHLDLQRIAPSKREERGAELARQLKVVLDRKLWVEKGSLSDDEAGDVDDGLPRAKESVGHIESQQGEVPIRMERLAQPNGTRSWKFDASTVASVPALHEEFGPGLIGQVLPPVFFSVSFLDVQLWQWVGLLLAVFVAWMLSWLIAFVLVLAASSLTRRSQTELDDRMIEMAAGPFRLLISVAMFASLTRMLGLALPVQGFFDQLARVGVIVALSWVLLRLVDVFARSIEARLVTRGQISTAAVVPIGRRAAKGVVLAFTTLAALQNFGFNVTGLIAGLGIGGLAVALAAQKTIENLFGGLTIIADQPVRVGDFCRFSGKLGTVEEIGLRSTRVRTLDRTVVSIPNAEFAAMQLENFARRDRIWLHTTIGVRYETTPDQLRHLLVELKKMLVAHPRVLLEPARVRFVGFGAYSLDVEIFAYVPTSDFDDFLAVREDVFLRIMDVVAASGTGFAFPSQTLYMASDAGFEGERAATAESNVRSWRENRSMPLPWMPLAQQRELAGTLDYPPEGSAPDGRGRT
ncbi:MAG: mechanosensitive ion channel family protein [Candidatus Binatia bacterium]